MYMKKIILTFPDNSTLEAESEITPVTLLSRFGNGRKVLAVRVNNEICSLYSQINISAHIEPVYDNTPEGAEIYRRSLCFVLAAAAHNIFPGARLLVGHSLGYGYYYTIDGRTVEEKDITQLKQEMQRIIAADEVISAEFISYQEACTLFEQLGLTV